MFSIWTSVLPLDLCQPRGFKVSDTSSSFQELPELVEGLFPVDGTKKSITGHSMGGHGAMVAYFRNPGMYR